MGKTSAQLIEEGRKDIAHAMSKIGRAMSVVMDGVSDDEIAAGFRCNQKDAPIFVHTIAKAYVAQVRIDATQAPAVQQSLSVTIVQRAGSNEEWLKMAEPYRKQLPATGEKLPPVIDVPATEAAKK